MLLLLVVAEDHIQPGPCRLAPQTRRFRRRVLAVVIQIDDVRTPGVTPAGEYRVVLAVVARVLDERNRDSGAGHQAAAHLAGAIFAAVVDQNDLVAALDRQALDIADHGGNSLRAAVQRDDERQRNRHDCDYLPPSIFFQSAM